jgi:tRNA-splicing ligase RtcB
MKHIQEGRNLVIKSWCDNPEEGAIDQALNLARLPFAFHHICVLPGVHPGYGMPIEAVLATEGVVVPYAVGVDVGCGMAAVRTSLRHIPIPALKDLLSRIRREFCSTLPKSLIALIRWTRAGRNCAALWLKSRQKPFPRNC